MRKLLPLFIPSLIVFIVLMKITDANQIRLAFQNVDYRLCALALLKIPIFVIAMMVRWHLILKIKHISVGYSNLFKAVMLGCFFNNITPGLKTGGEPAKAYYLAKTQGIDLTNSLASVAVDRMAQWIALALISVVSISFALSLPSLLGPSLKLISGIILGFISVTAILYYIGLYRFTWVFKSIESGRKLIKRVLRSQSTIRQPCWLGKIEKLHREYAKFFSNKRALFFVLSVNVFHFGIDLVFPWLIFKALHINVPLVIILFASILNKISGVFAVTPGGSGIVESVNYSLYALAFSIAHEHVVAQTILFRVIDGWLLWFLSGMTVAYIGQEFFTTKTVNQFEK